LQSLPIGVFNDLQAHVSGLAAYHARHGRPVVVPRAVATYLVGTLAWGILGVGMRNAFFPPRFETFRRLP
jgi:hypothetical protein